MPWILWLVTLEPSSLLPLAPGLILTIWARRRIRAAWKAATALTGLTGAELAGTLLRRGDHAIATILLIDGVMTDHYDPWSHTLRLSRSVHESRSLAALAVAAHEAAFARLRPWNRLRSTIVLAVSLGALTAWIVVAAGVLYRYTEMAEAGMALFSAVTIASLAAQPIERLAGRSSADAVDSLGASISPDERDAWARALDAASWRIVALPLTTRFMRI